LCLRAKDKKHAIGDLLRILAAPLSSERNKSVEAFTLQNFGLFGRPPEDGLLNVESINRLVLTRVGYEGHFGPVAY
jgi:hypothetical protein